MTDWPFAGLLAIAALVARSAGYGPARALGRGSPRAATRRSPGYAVALVALGAVAVATALVSPYGLVFVLPSLYAWLWLPQLAPAAGSATSSTAPASPDRPSPSSPSAPSSGSASTRPLYVVSLMTLGFIPWTTVLVLIAWAAVATQLGALAAGRYRPVESAASSDAYVAVQSSGR